MPSKVESDQGFPSGAIGSGPRGSVLSPEPPEWPTLWARCWSRIRTWRVPPRWSPCDWWEEARAQGALAACEAIRSFEPGWRVPLEAYLYRRVVEGVWTRYRQEWSFGRRRRPDVALPDRPAAASDRPDPELLARLASTLGDLRASEQWLIGRLFWEGDSEDELANELGVSRQAVNLRKQKLLRRLRSQLGIEAGGSS
jgi:DNA-directed RNA polymerase specialized sigma24 family protein